MKRAFCFLMALLLVGYMTACGKGETAPAETPAPAETAAAETTVATEQPTEPDTFTPIDPVVLIDSEQCYLEVNGLDMESQPGFLGLRTTMINKTQSLLSVQGITRVNGMTIDDTIYCEAEAGETVTEDGTILVEDLERLGVEQITDVEITPYTFANKDFGNKTYYDTVHIYPHGENAATAYEWQPGGTDILVFDNETAAAYITGFAPSAAYGQLLGINLVLINKTAEELMFYSTTLPLKLSDQSTRVFSCLVPANSTTLTTMGWREKELQERGVPNLSQLQELDFDLRAQKMGTPDNLANGNVKLLCLEGSLVLSNCDNGHKVRQYYTSNGETMYGWCKICDEKCEEPFDADVYIKGVLKDRWYCTGRMDGHVEDMAVYTAAKPGCVLPWVEFTGDEMKLVLIPGQEEIQGKLELAYVSEGGGSFTIGGQEVTSSIPTYVFNHVVDGKTVGSVRYFYQATVGGRETIQVCIDDGNGYEHTLIFANEMNVSSAQRQAMGSWSYDAASGGSGLSEGVENYKITVGENGAATLHFGTDRKVGLSYMDVQMGNFPGQTSDLPENVRLKYTMAVLNEDWNDIGTMYVYIHEDFNTCTMEYVEKETGATIPFVKTGD